MASAVYDEGHAEQAVRAAIGARRQRRDGRMREALRPAPQRRRAPAARGLWRGVGASGAIACGYVALMSALRALLSIS